MEGEIVSVHRSEDRYGGAFGEIRGDDGRHYTYSNRTFYRNGSHADVGGRVTFEVVEHNTYATNVDRIDKHQEKA